MAERWRYTGRKHPSYCTCVICKGDGPRHPHNQPSNQLRAILDKWRSKNFDPHFVLGVPPDSSRKSIVEAHRRWIVAYHPDKHNNDPLATELTKRLNAARDDLLGEDRRGARPQSKQAQNQEAARQQREREAERRRQEEAERIMRDIARGRQEAERLRQNQERRRSSRSRNQRVRPNRYRNSLFWPLSTVVLMVFIVVHLVLAVESPDAIDNMMQQWARLFDQAPTR